MTTTYDLTDAWITCQAGCPAGEGDAEGGATAADGSPSPAEANGAELTEDEVKNPRIKQLSDEAAKHRTTARTERLRADTAESRSRELEAELSSERIHNAFITAAAGKVNDLDAGWKLADKTGATIKDDGTVTGVDVIVAKLLEKYDYLAVEEVPLSPSGSPNNGPRRTTDLGAAALAEKFPALKLH